MQAAAPAANAEASPSSKVNQNKSTFDEFKELLPRTIDDNSVNKRGSASTEGNVSAAKRSPSNVRARPPDNADAQSRQPSEDNIFASVAKAAEQVIFSADNVSMSHRPDLTVAN